MYQCTPRKCDVDRELNVVYKYEADDAQYKTDERKIGTYA